MTEEDFWGRPFTPGPVRVDPDADAARAKVVREALLDLAYERTHPAISCHDRNAAENMAGCSDATLAKLGRMLK